MPYASAFTYHPHMLTFGQCLARAALCATALGSGMALGRYTDIGRDKLSMGPSLAHAAVPANKAAERKAEAPRHATALTVSEETPNDIEPYDPQEAAPEEPHDAFAESMRDGLIIKGFTPHRLILFTFDDGPDRYTTPRLLDRLDRTGVRAVFFLTGSNLRGTNVAERKNQEIAREAIARGHFLASHGMNHKQLPLLDDVGALTEVVEAEHVFERVFGQRPWLFRPPGGARSARIDRLLARRGYTIVLWNLSADDYQVRTAADVHRIWRESLERREAVGERGGVILLHDTYSWSVEAFQLIVDDLLARNCELLERGEELYDFVDDPTLFFQPRGQHGASVAAAPVRLPKDVLERRQARLREETAQRCASES